jgi:FtsP/CotA-like multicopper oxidase with cupredoxin domain
MDGVPAVSQCPIPPGGTFTYTFLADLYGTSWYHSHYSAQYAGGELGPMIIHGPDTVPYDIGEHFQLLFINNPPTSHSAKTHTQISAQFSLPIGFMKITTL